MLMDFFTSKASCLADLSGTPLYMELEKSEKEKSVKFRERCCWSLVLPCGQQNTERLNLLNLGLWLLRDSGSQWSWMILVLLKKLKRFHVIFGGSGKHEKKISIRNIRTNCEDYSFKCFDCHERIILYIFMYLYVQSCSGVAVFGCFSLSPVSLVLVQSLSDCIIFYSTMLRMN